MGASTEAGPYINLTFDRAVALAPEAGSGGSSYESSRGSTGVLLDCLPSPMEREYKDFKPPSYWLALKNLVVQNSNMLVIDVTGARNPSERYCDLVINEGVVLSVADSVSYVGLQSGRHRFGLSDTVPPTLVSSHPANGAADLGSAVSVTFFFSESVEPCIADVARLRLISLTADDGEPDETAAGVGVQWFVAELMLA
jgi:hypothetical protein